LRNVEKNFISLIVRGSRKFNYLKFYVQKLYNYEWSYFTMNYMIQNKLLFSMRLESYSAISDFSHFFL